MLLAFVFWTLKYVFNFLIDYTNSSGPCQERYEKFCKILTKIRQCIDREQAFTHMCVNACSSTGDTCGEFLSFNKCHLWVREGTWFPHTPPYGGVCWFFDFVEKPANPTTKLWHAAPCVFRRAQAKPTAGDPHWGSSPEKTPHRQNMCYYERQRIDL